MRGATINAPGAPRGEQSDNMPKVESRGIEPRSEPCKGPVLPLNYDPVVDMTMTEYPQFTPSFLALSSR